MRKTTPNQGYNTGVSSNKRSQSAASGHIDYEPVKRVDVYAGMMISNVYGGLANGFFKSQNLDSGAGIRIRFSGRGRKRRQPLVRRGGSASDDGRRGK